MNVVNLIGRLTADPEIVYTRGENPMCIASFTLAVDRIGSKDKGADFPRIKAFGKPAEVFEKYLHKGSRIGITGKIQTGSYKDKNGNNVYTTDVVVAGFEFLDSKREDDDDSFFEE